MNEYDLRPTTLYRFFDAEGTLLYVGISSSTLARIASHTTQSPWFPLAVSATFETFPDRASALKAEGEAIRSQAPMFNRTHGNLHPEAAEKLRRQAIQDDWDRRRGIIKDRTYLRSQADDLDRRAADEVDRAEYLRQQAQKPWFEIAPRRRYRRC